MTNELEDLAFGRPYSVLLIVFSLTLVAAVPRFYELGALGFYGDEETTSFPARSLAEGNGAQMPSGMPYRRALPHTWLNAISARVFGLDQELSYRVAGALLGTLTIPLLFIMARPFVGGAIALVAAVLLAFSEWHIITSREARMYAPFLFFYVGAGFAIWRWSVTGAGRDMLVASTLLAMAVSFHALGIFAAIFALIPIAWNGGSRVSPLKLIVFALISAAAARIYSHQFVMGAYDSWQAASASASAAIPVEDPATAWLLAVIDAYSPQTVIAVLIGVILGSWVASASRVQDDDDKGAVLRTLSRYVLAILLGSLACLGQLYGAMIAGLLFLLIHPDNLTTLFTRARVPISVISLAAICHGLTAIWQLGLTSGLRALAAFPFPYPTYFAHMFPGVLMLFVGMSAYLAVRACRSDDYASRASVLATVLPLIVLGVVSEWGGQRYLIETYPFLLLVASAGLIRMLTALTHWIGKPKPAVPLLMSIAVVLSGALSGHGVYQSVQAATITYGQPFNRLGIGFSFYPDHQSAGQFVRRHRAPNDIVIAEDVLQQHWYTKHVDYWLRDPATHHDFLYPAPDGYLRDIYVNSAIATSEILHSFDQSIGNHIWLITSAETHGQKDFYLGPAQQQWLETVRQDHTPVFAARDGLTFVYCLNCPFAQTARSLPLD